MVRAFRAMRLWLEKLYVEKRVGGNVALSGENLAKRALAARHKREL